MARLLVVDAESAPPELLGAGLTAAGHEIEVVRTAAEALEAAARPFDLVLLDPVGTSIVMRALYKLLGLLAASRATVLIRGESGTGKELAARILHDFGAGAGPGATAPFVVVNCAALPAPLVEAEVFGYRRGAFTGAAEDRAGKLEAAGAGTLFFDEVGEVPLDTQVE